jgi:hypothetical protein
MPINGLRCVRTQRSIADPSPQKQAGRSAVRFFGACSLFVVALASLMAGGSLAVSGGAPAGASPAGNTVHCPTDNLQTAINAAATGARLLVEGTCAGNFYIQRDLTLTGPATLDGGGNPATTLGATLNVMAGTVVLNGLVIQHGDGNDGLGGGLWNSGQLTLNLSMVTHNIANGVGGIFNMGQLTLNGSTVSDNTATDGTGGIFNCAASLHDYGLCTGAPGSLTLNNSIVSDNVAGSGDGGGIVNDVQAVMTLDNSSVSGNTTDTGYSGGGIENNGTATLNNAAVWGNTGGSGGGIMNNGTATLNKAIISNNASTSGSESFGGGGGLSNGLSSTGPTTLNDCIIRANSAAWLGGGIFAGGGPMKINNSIVTGNTAGTDGGGMLVWSGPTTVANSVFAKNSDPGLVLPDTLPGVLVVPDDFLGFGNTPTFTTTHSTYS